MARLLIVYGPARGHAREVADRIAGVARASGYEVRVADGEVAPDLAWGACDAVVVAAPGYRHGDPAGVAAWARRNLRVLRRIPNAFFSLGPAASPAEDRHRTQAWARVDAFTRETGWRPCMAWLVEGALQPNRWDAVEHALRRWFAPGEGDGRDPGVDRDPVDWTQLDRNVGLFLRVAGRARPRPRPAELPAATAGTG